MPNDAGARDAAHDAGLESSRDTDLDVQGGSHADGDAAATDVLDSSNSEVAGAASRGGERRTAGHDLAFRERDIGFEPATFSLGSAVPGGIDVA